MVLPASSGKRGENYCYRRVLSVSSRRRGKFTAVEGRCLCLQDAGETYCCRVARNKFRTSGYNITARRNKIFPLSGGDSFVQPNVQANVQQNVQPNVQANLREIMFECVPDFSLHPLRSVKIGSKICTQMNIISCRFRCTFGCTFHCTFDCTFRRKSCNEKFHAGNVQPNV